MRTVHSFLLAVLLASLPAVASAQEKDTSGTNPAVLTRTFAVSNEYRFLSDHRFHDQVLVRYTEPFQDDDGDFANARNDGFKGRSIAVGPLVKYKAKFGEATEIDFSLRWAHEVEVENRMKGDAIFFSLAGKF